MSVIEHTYKGERAADLFPVLAYSKEYKLFFLDDRSLAFSFICYPLPGADETVNSRINNFLNGEWPSDTSIQISLFSSDNINKQVNGYLIKRAGIAEPLFQQMADQRASFLKESSIKALDRSTGIKARNFHLLFTVKIPIKAFEPSDDEIEAAIDLQITTSKSLDTIGLQPVALNNDTYIAVMDDILHHGQDASWRDNFARKADEDKPLNQQLLDWDKSIDVDDKGLWIGSQRVKTLGVKRFPELAFPGFGVNYIGDIMTGSRGLRGQFIINMTITFPEAQKARFALDKKRTFTIAQATGPLQKFVPILAEKAKGFNLLNKALDDGDKPVKLYFSVSVFGDDEEDATEQATNVRSYLSELGFQMVPDRYYCLPMFLNSLPFGADREAISDLFRYKTMATRHAAVLMPIFADWRGTGSPLLNYLSRNGQIMNVDLFDSETNYNCVIAAASGAGKSFQTNNMITNYLSIGGKAWVIDVGRSYEKLCENYNGDFIHFGKDSDICLNPFELVKDIEEEIDIIMGLVAAMAAPTSQLSDLQMQELLKIMLDLWEEHKHSMNVDLIEQSCLTHPDQRIKDIGSQLFAFTSRGPYGKYFIGKNNVNFQNNFTVLELDDLQGREHLMQVVLLQLIYQIQQDMYLGDRDRRKLVFIDEAWSLLSNGNVGKFIEHGYRRFRKYGGAAITITQSIMDLYVNPTGRAMAENSANMYLMRQKGEALNNLKSKGYLPLGEGAYELLKTVRTVEGSFSETFFITEFGCGIGRLIVDPYQILLYSTKANDVHAIKQYTNGGASIDEAITNVLRDRAHGN